VTQVSMGLKAAAEPEAAPALETAAESRAAAASEAAPALEAAPSPLAPSPVPEGGTAAAVTSTPVFTNMAVSATGQPTCATVRRSTSYVVSHGPPPQGAIVPALPGGVSIVRPFLPHVGGVGVCSLGSQSLPSSSEGSAQGSDAESTGPGHVETANAPAAESCAPGAKPVAKRAHGRRGAKRGKKASAPAASEEGAGGPQSGDNAVKKAKTEGTRRRARRTAAQEKAKDLL
jgi:hypothetical protein